MKKILSLILALCMFLAVVPAVAETAEEVPAEDGGLGGLSELLGGLGGEGSEGGLSDMLGGLLGGDGSEGSEGGLGSLFGGLMGKLSDLGGSLNLSGLFSTLKEKLAGLKDVDLKAIIELLKGKLVGLKSSLSGLLGGLTGGSDGTTKSAEGEEVGDLSALSGLLGGLLGGSDGTTESAEGEAGASESGDLSSLSGLLGGLLGGTGEGESTDGSGAADLIGGILGSLTGDGTDAGSSFDKLIEEYYASPEYQDSLARDEALKVYLNEEYQDLLEAGDVQIISKNVVTGSEEGDPNVRLGYYGLANYTVDGTDLKLKNFVGNTELLTYAKQDDGTFKVVDAVVADEGEKAEASIEKMLETVGLTMDDYNTSMSMNTWSGLYDMVAFLDAHPEYERIEFQGELKTRDELDALADAEMEALLSSL